MRVVLIRHFKVGFKWRRFYTSAEYERACSGYNSADVEKSEIDFRSSDRLITSTMSRALDTSRHIFKREPDVSHQDLCEVPIKPFTDTSIPLPKLFFDVIGRLQWRFGLSRQPETYRKSRERVSRFVNRLLDDGADVVIVCHGWIIKLLIRELKSHGFKGPDPLFIRNGVPYQFVNVRPYHVR